MLSDGPPAPSITDAETDGLRVEVSKLNECLAGLMESIAIASDGSAYCKLVSTLRSNAPRTNSAMPAVLESECASPGESSR